MAFMGAKGAGPRARLLKLALSCWGCSPSTSASGHSSAIGRVAGRRTVVGQSGGLAAGMAGQMQRHIAVAWRAVLFRNTEVEVTFPVRLNFRAMSSGGLRNRHKPKAGANLDAMGRHLPSWAT